MCFYLGDKALDDKPFEAIMVEIVKKIARERMLEETPGRVIVEVDLCPQWPEDEHYNSYLATITDNYGDTLELWFWYNGRDAQNACGSAGHDIVFDCDWNT